MMEFEQVTIEEAPGFVKDIGADKVDFKFKSPKSIEIGGSYSIKCIVKPDINVDLFIQLPKVLVELTVRLFLGVNIC